MDNKMLHMASFFLVVVGGLNWGLVGLFNFNLVEVLFGQMPQLVQLTYVLVGVAAVYLFATHQSDCKVCSGKKK